MTRATTEPAGPSAAALAARVRSGEDSPVEAVAACLARIEERDAELGAFVRVRRERALEEAEALSRRPDLAELPLAGVPIAVKDNLAVAGEPMRVGSAATPASPREADHEAVRRLREAGAIVVGITRMPELGVWATSDGPDGIARNPWDPARTAGGSSGGSAAAVAAGLVPLALGNDGLGSIRIPAAACGIFGIKPGAGLVPGTVGETGWFGLAENGPLAATVHDAALALSVLAGRPNLSDPEPPRAPLRIAVSVRNPVRGLPVDREWVAAAYATARLLAGAGHRVERADPRYPNRLAPASLARWLAGTAQEAENLERRALQPRTRGHARAGRIVRRLGLVRPAQRDAWIRSLAPFFTRYDLLLTPALAAPPIAAGPWCERSWLANLWSNIRYAPFASPWNLAGFPAAAVPAGLHSCGTPLSVQLVAPRGGEAVVLAVARQLEEARPWGRGAGAG